MGVILIHKLRGIVPPEMLIGSIELGKKLIANPEDLVPGGKIIACYSARGFSMIVCIWEVSSVKALMPFVEQLYMLGWDTDTVPADDFEVALPKHEKAIQAMLARVGEPSSQIKALEYCI